MTALTDDAHQHLAPPDHLGALLSRRDRCYRADRDRCRVRRRLDADHGPSSR